MLQSAGDDSPVTPVTPVVHVAPQSEQVGAEAAVASAASVSGSNAAQHGDTKKKTTATNRAVEHEKERLALQEKLQERLKGHAELRGRDEQVC